jgi:SAM-dependent methyltransferase
MSSSESISAPQLLAAPRLARLRAHLHAIGYRFDAVKARLGLPHYAQWAPDGDGAIAPALEPYVPYLGAYLAGPDSGDSGDPGGAGDTLDVVLRLLLLNVPVALDDARRAFPGELLGDLADARLVQIDLDAGTAWAALSLWEIDGLFIATDALQAQDPAASPANPVMPLLPECYELAQSRLPGEQVLDLCTGSGVHALLAARGARRVTGVDINPRAVAFARFNQALNAIDHATFVEGDLYAVLPPGARYDLIVANPPYSPATDSAAGDNFYAGGRFGDEITARILAGLAAHLTDAGTCQIITLLAHWKAEPLEARLRRFLGADGARYDLVFTVNPLPFDAVLRYLDGLIDLDAVRRDAERFEYGMFHLRRRATGAGRAQVVPFRPGEPPTVASLLAATGAADAAG